MSWQGDPGFFLIVPVLNEARNIGALVARTRSGLSGRAFTLCFIDDGSRDGTLELIEKEISLGQGDIHLIRRQKKLRGSQRGSALLSGIEWGIRNTRHQVFVEMDGDLSHRPEEILKSASPVLAGTCDIVIASKYLRESRVTNRPLGRRLVSRVCSFCVGLLIDPRIGDYSNGFRVYNRGAAETVLLRRIKYGSPIYLSEVLALWLREKFRVREQPSLYIGRNEGVSKLRIVDLVKACVAIFEINFKKI
jgi:dolichol-phosphate mannosyltransferase